MKRSLRERLPFQFEGLTIRRLIHEDFADLLEYWSDPEVARYQFEEPYIAEQVAAMIESQGEVHVGDPGVALVLAAVLEEERKVIGDCQLVTTSGNDRQGELGFTFNPRYAGKGLATRAVIASLGFGFIHLGLHRIVASTDVRNERSWRLMERVGMRREAHFLHDCFVKGEWVSDYVYAMLDEEWHRQHGALSAAMLGERASA